MSMWRRQRPTHERPTFREEMTARTFSKVGLLYWAFVLAWVLARSVAHGFSLLLSTRVGRVVGGLAVVALLVGASYGADLVTLPVDTAVVLLAAAAKRMSIPDGEHTEEPRPLEVGSRDGSEIERGAVMSGKPENGEEHAHMDETKRNSEAKFANPDGSSVGIGYYFDGEEVSPEEFGRLVEEKADRIRGERDDG